MISTLYERHYYRNKNIFILTSTPIIEYDMKEAGFSLIREYKLLSDKTIEFLLTKDKLYRTIFIGKERGKNKDFSKRLTESFVKARKLFFENNQVEDKDIVTIHNDAIFLNKVCNITQFGEFIDFRVKHQYSSYMYISMKEVSIPIELEMYYSKDELSIKGIDDESLKKHEDGMINIINRIFYLLETSPKHLVYRYIRDIKDKYVKLELPVNYYREFNTESLFNVPNSGAIRYDNYFEDKKDNLVINYNIFLLSTILKHIL